MMGAILVNETLIGRKRPKSQTRKRTLLHDVQMRTFGGGTGYIAGEGEGIVTVNGRPASRRVIAFAPKYNFKPVRSTWSNPDGTYRLANLDIQSELIVMAIDHEGLYEPVAYDGIKPQK